MKGGQCGQRAVDQHHHEIFGVESRVLLCASHAWLMTRRVLWLSPLLEDDKFWTGRLREAPCHVGSTCLRLLLPPDTKLPLPITACHHTPKGPLSDGGSVSNSSIFMYKYGLVSPHGRSLDISNFMTQTWT